MAIHEGWKNLKKKNLKYTRYNIVAMAVKSLSYLSQNKEKITKNTQWWLP